MAPDQLYALLLLGLLLMVISYKQFSVRMLELLLKLSRPGATVLILGLIAFLYTRNLVYTALALALVSGYLLKDIWKTWPRSDARRLYLEVQRDKARFDPMTSIDLQFANGSVTHGAPSMLSEPSVGKMLIFPPSVETLREMSG